MTCISTFHLMLPMKPKSTAVRVPLGTRIPISHRRDMTAGLRVVLSLRLPAGCTSCHNPDPWHLKDGTYVSADRMLSRLANFTPALRSLEGGLTI